MTSPSQRQNIFDLSPRDLETLLASWGEKRFRVQQIIEQAWKPHAVDFQEARSLPLALRARLDETFFIPPPAMPSLAQESPDGTVKAVFTLADGAQIESVSIPRLQRLTFCLSTQCGCALGCKFCATARLGFTRNLTAGEIIGQIRGLMARGGQRPTNLVMMGMGEPLQNLPAVRAALELITHPKALNWSPLKTTVSTSGWLPGIEALTREPIPAKLSFSLNAAMDETRSGLMPVNRRYPLADVMAALRKYHQATGQTLSIQYVLLSGVNDRAEDAVRLGRLVQHLPCKINLIPFNVVPGLSFAPATAAAIAEFRKVLRPYHAMVTVRLSRGDTIGAACGQLAGRALGRAA